MSPCSPAPRLSLLCACLLITACSTGGRKPDRPAREPPHYDGAPPVPLDIASIPEPVPRAEPLARYGNHSPYVVFGQRYHLLPTSKGYVERGIASWYGTKFHGRPTSTREPYDMYQLTAAHKTLPLPCYARVTNLENGRSLIVRINDRGPFHGDRLIDLSYASAVRLGIHIKGTARVEVRVLDPADPLPAPDLRLADADDSPAAVQVLPLADTAPATASELLPAAARGDGSGETLPRPSGTRALPATALLEATELERFELALRDPAEATTAGPSPEALPRAEAPARAPADASDPVDRTAGAPGGPATRVVWLQLGVFGARHNAEALKERLTVAGFGNAEVLTEPGSAGDLHRVALGPLLDDSEVEQISALLALGGFDRPHRLAR